LIGSKPEGKEGDGSKTALGISKLTAVSKGRGRRKPVLYKCRIETKIQNRLPSPGSKGTKIVKNGGVKKRYEPRSLQWMVTRIQLTSRGGRKGLCKMKTK